MRKLGNDSFKNQRIWIYFISVFVFSWLMWIPVIIFQENEFIKNFREILFFIGILAPSSFGIFLTYVFEGSGELKNLLKRGIKGFKLSWFVFIFLFTPTIVVISLFITAGFSNTFVLLTDIPRALGAFIMFPFILLIGGPLFEEFGWRGFALDRLQSKWNSIISSVVLGFFWGIWHLPAFFIVGTSQNILLEYIPIVAGLFFIQIIFVTIIISWIYNSTERSILSVLLFHTMWNTAFGGFFMAILTGFVTDPSSIANDDAIINNINLANIILTLVLFISVVVVIFKWGKNLGKKETNFDT